MDHDHDHGTGNTDDGSVSCPMIMSFHAGHCETILWSGWIASTVTEFVFSALAIFLVAFGYEALKFVREHFLRKTIRKEAERLTVDLQFKNAVNAPTSGPNTSNMADIPQKTYFQKIMAGPHLMQTCFNLIQIVISYLLMLIFMTFNYWLCLAVILGLGVGYYFFGWIKTEVYDNECCH